MLEALRGAIARLTLGESRGTAFLVSRQGHVLTAAHCLAFDGATPQDPKWIIDRAAPLKLAFGDPAEPFETTAAFDEGPIAFDVDRDWALVKCDPVPDVAPVELGAHDETDREWACWGFPSTVEDLPEAYNGTVTLWAKPGGRFQLQFNQAGPATRVSGMSGAPVVVGGEAVGIVVQDISVDGVTGEPVLFARLLDIPALRAAGLTVRDSPLPLQRPLLHLLKLTDQLADDVAERLRLRSLLGRSRDRAIARRLLTVPFSHVVACQDKLASVRPEPQFVGRLLCAARLPAPALAAAGRHLLDDESKSRGVIVRGRQSITPEWHAVGICAPEHYGELASRVFTISLSDGSTRPTGTQLLERLKAVIAAAFPLRLDKDDPTRTFQEVLYDELGGSARVFVVVRPPVNLDQLDEVVAAFPSARFVVRTERDVLDTASFAVVEEALGDEDESAMSKAYQAMPRSLR